MNERIKFFINYLIETRKVFNQTDFANIIGKSKSQMSEMINGKRSISEQTVHIIASKFPDLNIDWLLYGEGEMIKNSGNFIQGDVNGGVVQSGGSHQNINISLPSEGEQKIIRPDGTVEVQKSDSNYTRLLEQRVEDLERIIKSKDEMIDLLKQINNK